jgi:hypothetical protein
MQFTHNLIKCSYDFIHIQGGKTALDYAKTEEMRWLLSYHMGMQVDMNMRFKVHDHHLSLGAITLAYV